MTFRHGLESIKPFTTATYVENGWNFAPGAWVWQESQHFPGFGFSGETDTLPIGTVGETKTVTYNGSTHAFPAASLFTSLGAGASLEDFDFELFKTGQNWMTAHITVQPALLTLGNQGLITERHFDGTTQVNVTESPALTGFASGDYRDAC